jgi:hypothetical protein
MRVSYHHYQDLVVHGRLSPESPVLAERTTDYATSVGTYLRPVRSKVPASLPSFDFTLLHDSIARLNQVAVQFDSYAAALEGRVQQRRFWWDFWTEYRLQSRIRAINQVYMPLGICSITSQGWTEDPGRNMWSSPKANGISTQAFFPALEMPCQREIPPRLVYELLSLCS